MSGIGAGFPAGVSGDAKGVMNCRTCHDNQNPKILPQQPANRSAEDQMAWMTNVTQQACNTCHAVDFTNHFGNQPGNVQCGECHSPTRSLPVAVAHATPYSTPNNPELYLIRGKRLLWEKNTDAAVAEIRKAIEKNDSRPHYYIELARALMTKEGGDKEAEETLKERQTAARGEAASGEPAWATDLKELINMLPPKNLGVDDPVEMVDGRGKSSSALQGSSEGSRACRLLLLAASKSRATDIHSEPKGDAVQVRMRIDGQMVNVVNLPNNVGELVNGLVKTACQMRPTGREAVLDGHFSTKPFATRALDAEGSRVWLLKDRLKRVEGRGHEPVEEPVADEDWEPTLQQWFGMTRPRI